jgi:hypothetical protein
LFDKNLLLALQGKQVDFPMESAGEGRFTAPQAQSPKKQFPININQLKIKVRFAGEMRIKIRKLAKI